METLSDTQSKKFISDLRSQIRSTPRGESVELSVIRESVPSSTISVNNDNLLVVKRTGRVKGLDLGRIRVGSERIKSDSGPAEAAWLALQKMQRVLGDTVVGILDLIAYVFLGKGELNFLRIFAPVVTASLDIFSSPSISLVSLMVFLAAFNVQSSVLSALPIPGFDGGHVLVILLFALTGRRGILDVGAEGIISSVCYDGIINLAYLRWFISSAFFFFS
uniref:Peptidase M50 domain-containing protein n=1 Tax=Cyclophora tenuis TaxID=216820 RepID=A0A7S1GI01_CYCTE|mmetsp:Transcript_16188/g.27431  ORF Transcript_16188/g.27431 Transcript_16188/m.27431 type:complete len:220 (+) Transcript_16188:95-754(+)